MIVRRAGRDDAGSAIIEFVFAAVVLMVPLVYLIAAVATIQRSTLAVTQAAREAGRAFATADDPSDAQPRMAAAVRLALADQGLPDDVLVRFVAAGQPCDGPPVTPALAPGAEFAICVTRPVQVPAVPSVLAGRGITTTGVYVVHVDDYRAAG